VTEEPVDISATLARIEQLKAEARAEALKELNIQEDPQMPLKVTQPTEPRCSLCGRKLEHDDDGNLECPDRAEHVAYAEDIENG